MKITFWGTRGSVPIANKFSHNVGGNTTCVEVESPCLPHGVRLAIDAGTGFIPFSDRAFKTKTGFVHVLFTHYHHDHTQGLLLGSVTHNKRVKLSCWGPVELGYGPKKVLKTIMQPPFFPIDFSAVAARFTCRGIQNPNVQVIVCHETGGVRMVSVEEFTRSECGNQIINFGQLGSYPISECLVIKMHYSNHPERTISYRFEERPSGKVFVFLTDHENQEALPGDLERHLLNADLLVMDAQYSQAQYQNGKAGFGHGTPGFCVRVAATVKAKKLGLTHHDPHATDQYLYDNILLEARQRHELVLQENPNARRFRSDELFVCLDHQVVELNNLD